METEKYYKMNNERRIKPGSLFTSILLPVKEFLFLCVVLILS